MKAYFRHVVLGLPWALGVTAVYGVAALAGFFRSELNWAGMLGIGMLFILVCGPLFSALLQAGSPKDRE